MATCKRMQILILSAVVLGTLVGVRAQYNYADALDKAICFFEGQRSGVLPSTQRETWRGNSGLSDGKAEGVDLTGGYYDAGDNIKFGFPMAFTVTILSWSALEYPAQLSSASQTGYLQAAIRWGTDWFIKAHTSANTLWGQVGEGVSDHSCWERPEDMDTLRTASAITEANPGTELAGEAAAAMAAASMVFKSSDAAYSSSLLTHAKQLFDFANKYRGDYSVSIPNVQAYYKSWSGYNDELVWAAAWLYRATGDATYLNFILSNEASLTGTGYQVMFTWDNKFAGAQILLANVNPALRFTNPSANVFTVLLKKQYDTSDGATTTLLQKFKTAADAYVCSILPNNPLHTVSITPGGLVFQGTINSQYALDAALLIDIYGDYLTAANQPFTCGSTTIPVATAQAFAKSQMDYLLGTNPKSMSYMVGFGANYPQQLHHRGSSVPSIVDHPAKIACGESWAYESSTSPNPNVHVGAIVAGPDQTDNWVDDRTNYNYNEPTTYINAAAVGVLAKLVATTGGGGATPSPPPPVPAANAPLPSQSPPPPSQSPPVPSQGPPLPSQSPSPPVTSVPPRPDTTSAPPTPAPAGPIAGADQVAFTQVTDYKDLTTGQYRLLMTNKGPGKICALTLHLSNYQPTVAWGLTYDAATQTAGLAAYNFPLQPGGVIENIGYRQSGGQAVFAVATLQTC
eukprot:jgi/Mesen1/6199/ME000032S05488